MPTILSDISSENLCGIINLTLCEKKKINCIYNFASSRYIILINKCLFSTIICEVEIFSSEESMCFFFVPS